MAASQQSASGFESACSYDFGSNPPPAAYARARATRRRVGKMFDWSILLLIFRGAGVSTGQREKVGLILGADETSGMEVEVMIRDWSPVAVVKLLFEEVGSLRRMLSS